MHTRIDADKFFSLCPQIPKALMALDEVAIKQGVSATLVHLVKMRVSQINGCAFCQHMHAAEAREDGELQERLDVLISWREVHAFTQTERAALAWAEALTLVAQQPVAQSVYNDVLQALGEQKLAALSATILAINSWNRVAIGMAFTPDIKMP